MTYIYFTNRSILWCISEFPTNDEGFAHKDSTTAITRLMMAAHDCDDRPRMRAEIELLYEKEIISKDVRDRIIQILVPEGSSQVIFNGKHKT